MHNYTKLVNHNSLPFIKKRRATGSTPSFFCHPSIHPSESTAADNFNGKSVQTLTVSKILVAVFRWVSDVSWRIVALLRSSFTAREYVGLAEEEREQRFKRLISVSWINKIIVKIVVLALLLFYVQENTFRTYWIVEFYRRMCILFKIVNRKWSKFRDFKKLWKIFLSRFW